MKKHKGEENKPENHAAAAAERVCAPEAQAAPEQGKNGGKPGSQAAAGDLGKQAAQAAEYYCQLQRLQADFENYRKRIEKEKPELIRWGKAEILLKLLPLYDLLLAAHSHVNSAMTSVEGSCDETLKGLDMIFKEFSKVFEAEGIRPMEPLGKPYDPMASEILGIVDGADAEDGLVMEELQKGFYYGEKILRPARVKIAKKKSPAGEEPVPPGGNKTAQEPPADKETAD